MKALLFFLAAISALLLAGCTNVPQAPQAAATSLAGASPQPTSTSIPVTSMPPSTSTPSVGWAPPTALVGTPIPGAEATLTAAPSLPTGSLVITNSQNMAVTMAVEIASSEADRELGLMFRSSLPQDAGMLFDFGLDTTGGFWMQNTILPLSIAFIQADGKIIDVKDMQPLDTTTVNASAPYRYALETNQGFFATHNITPGNQVMLTGAQSAALPGMPSCAQ